MRSAPRFVIHSSHHLHLQQLVYTSRNVCKFHVQALEALAHGISAWITIHVTRV